MARKISISVLLIIFFSQSTIAQQMIGFDSMIRKLATDFETPGIAVAVMKNYEYKEYFYGYSNLSEKKLLTNKTAFNVASISKLVTAHVVMQLAEQGKVDLDKPIQSYLTQWKFPTSQFDPIQITVRTVLNHSAGLSTEFGPGFSSKDTLLSLPDILSGKSPKRKALRIINQPGTEHIYSNLAFGLLQLLVEEVTGQPFQEYVESNFFSKLNMTKSSFQDPLKLDKNFELATPYDYRLNPLEQERFVVVAAAGLQTNLADLEKLMLEESRDKKLLTRKSFDELHDTSLNTKYGLGHMVSKNKGNVAFIGHTGLGMGWNASFQFIPGSGDGIIVLTNGDNGFYIHNTLICSWYYSLSGSYTSECSVAPDKKLNRISLYLEIATEQGVLKKQDFETFNNMLEESKRSLRNNNFKLFSDQLKTLESKLKISLTDPAIQKNMREAFQDCYYWIGMPWFDK